MAVDDWPLLRWRMRQYRHGRWGTHIVKANPQLADDIVAAVTELGPSTAGQIEAYLEAEPRGATGPWWGRSDTKWVAEALFAAGVLTTATRVGFARHYDLVERVLPAPVLARQVDDDEAVRELVLRAATALGVGTEADIRDYFRLSAQQTRPAVAELVAGGALERVDVEGWPPAYLRPPNRAARRSRDRAAVPVRPADLLPAPGGAAVRLSLPHRDLHTRGQTPLRVLRMAFPAGRPTGGASRSQIRPGCRRAASGGGVRRSRDRPAPGCVGADRGAGVDGLVARPGPRRRERPGDLAADLRSAVIKRAG